jgi:hypothetical protein
VPLVVVVAADPRHSIGIDVIRGAVDGKLTLTVNLNLFKVGPSSSGPLKLHPTDTPRRRDPCLSCIAWLTAAIDDLRTLTLFNHQYAGPPAALPLGERIIQGQAGGANHGCWLAPPSAQP